MPGIFITYYFITMAKQVKQPDPIKYSVGNDISKDEMSVCFSQINSQQHVSIKGTRKFENNLRVTWSRFTAHKIPLTLHKDGKKDIKKETSEV